MIACEKRVQKHLETLAQFTATPGNGTTRMSYSPEYQLARQYLKSQMQAIGLIVREDAFGNIYGRLEGRDPSLPPIIIGSHFDSVPNGGAFDGPAGVVTGLEVLSLFKEQALQPRYPIEAIALLEEEGASFGAGLLGSRVLTGKVNSHDLKNMYDEQGISAAEKMAKVGLNADNIAHDIKRKGDIRAFIELHIEQGPVLESTGNDIGIIDTIVGISQLIVTVEGKAGHAGTTPMNMRADALLATSYLIQAINRFAIEATESVATVGKISVYPNGANVIPDKVIFSVDIRSKHADQLAQLIANIKTSIIEANNNEIKASFEEPLSVTPVHLNDNISGLLQKHSNQLAITNLTMASGAGHDAMVLAEITDVGLVFVPSKNGLSHHPDEWTDYAQICKGIDVIFETVKDIAEVAK